MMQWKRALSRSSIVACLVLGAAEADAEAPCRPGHTVDLTIELEPPEAGAHQRLQQRLTAEMRARDLDVCAAGLGGRSLAGVRVSAPLPALSPTSVEVRTAGGAALQRSLDVAALPLEARPSAIASATDELLSSLLQGAVVSPTIAPVAAEQARTTDEMAPPARKQGWKVPRLELGLGGGGGLFEKRSKAYRAELLARWHPFSRLFTTLRLGADRRLTRETPWSAASTGLRIVDRAEGWHTGLDVGLELSEPRQGFGLAAVAGLGLARLELIEEWPVATPVGTGVRRQSAGSSWEAAANLGGELSFRAGGWGADLALSVLVPFTARQQNWQESGLGQVSGDNGAWDFSSATSVPPGAGFGEQLGAQLDLRLWVALDS